jgi:predicted anti-sigma-YlaC factor YlaD
VTGELALGALTGRQRARAIEHLERCDACRRRVGDMTGTAEQLLRLLPECEPPPGFAIRVASRIAQAKRLRTWHWPGRRRRR